MNSFAVLLDDVEDADDLSVNIPAKAEVEDNAVKGVARKDGADTANTPAVTIQDARAASSRSQRPPFNRGRGRGRGRGGRGRGRGGGRDAPYGSGREFGGNRDYDGNREYGRNRDDQERRFGNRDYNRDGHNRDYNLGGYGRDNRDRNGQDRDAYSRDFGNRNNHGSNHDQGGYNQDGNGRDAYPLYGENRGNGRRFSRDYNRSRDFNRDTSGGYGNKGYNDNRNYGEVSGERAEGFGADSNAGNGVTTEFNSNAANTDFAAGDYNVDAEKEQPNASATDGAVEGGVDTAEDGESGAPKEKEMSLDEYLSRKAESQLNVRLSAKNIRKANNGEGYGKMAVLKKTLRSEDDQETSILSNVSIKPEQETRSLKDSTHAAVADNAKNQSFFKADPSGGNPRMGSDSRRGSNGDARRTSDYRGYGGRSNFDGGPHGNRGSHDGGYNGRGGYNGGRYHDRDRYDGHRPERDYRRDQRDGFNTRNKPDSRHVSNIAPNVDDTSAFPSLGA